MEFQAAAQKCQNEKKREKKETKINHMMMMTNDDNTKYKIQNRKETKMSQKLNHKLKKKINTTGYLV